jgi:hypothetical protein
MALYPNNVTKVYKYYWSLALIQAEYNMEVGISKIE